MQFVLDPQNEVSPSEKNSKILLIRWSRTINRETARYDAKYMLTMSRCHFVAQTGIINTLRIDQVHMHHNNILQLDQVNDSSWTKLRV